ncbi:MAG TPA: DUF4136 domain-containing protein [Polyangiaceae bacterium]|nr:DUF4136 domain-containing protein [Polyangiaceae bacterium]
MTLVHSAPAMRWRSLLFSALLAAPFSAFIGACSPVPTSDIHVQSAADEKANLAGYKTFAWFASDSTLVDRTGVWVEKDFDARQEIEFLVDQALRRHGLTVSQGEPDLLVDLSILAEVQNVEEKKTERRQGLTFDPVGEGALVVELIDAHTEKTVWIGGAKGDLRSSRSTEESKQRLAYAVDEMFKTLPE